MRGFNPLVFMLLPARVIEILNNSGQRPEFPVLKRWTDVYYSVSLHTKGARPSFVDAEGSTVTPPNFFGEEYQNLFDRFLFARHPREPKATRNWRFSQYKPFTQAPFLQLIDIVIGAIFQDSQYTLTIPNAEDSAYITGNNFEGGDGVRYDLMSYFSRMLALQMFEDPNGYIVRIPARPYYETTTQRVEVRPFFVRSVDVIFPPDGDDFIFKTADGKFAYWINRVAIFRFVKGQGADAHKWVIEDGRGYYAHLFGYIPASKAGGVWNSEGFYNSFLFKAIPIADEYIASYSAEQMVDKEASHPFIQQAAVDCPTCEGQGQVQKSNPCADCPGGVEYALATCPTCRGRKMLSYNPADRLEAPLADMEKDLIKIISPPMEVNDYHRKKNQQLLMQILDALNLLKVEQAQSGVAKAIDQERLYAFISFISNHVFDNLIFSTIRDIIGYRNVQSVNGRLMPNFYAFTLIKPSQFQIKTAADLLAELTEAAEAPAIIRRSLVLEFVDKRFGGDEALLLKTRLMAQLDKAFVFTAAEKGQMRLSGELSADDLHLSINLPLIMDAIEREKGAAFFNSDFAAIKQEVDTRLATIPKATPAVPTTTPTPAAA